jgi:hypothetical protein
MMSLCGGVTKIPCADHAMAIAATTHMIRRWRKPHPVARMRSILAIRCAARFSSAPPIST